jgi:ubiquitin-conjugating enzyme E2 R
LLSYFLIRKQVSLSKIEAEKDGVTVPVTLEDYLVKSKPPESSTQELTDYYDDDYDLDNDDDDGEESTNEMDYDDDSGNGDES